MHHKIIDKCVCNKRGIWRITKHEREAHWIAETTALFWYCHYFLPNVFLIFLGSKVTSRKLLFWYCSVLLMNFSLIRNLPSSYPRKAAAWKKRKLQLLTKIVMPICFRSSDALSFINLSIAPEFLMPYVHQAHLILWQILFVRSNTCYTSKSAPKNVERKVWTNKLNFSTSVKTVWRDIDPRHKRTALGNFCCQTEKKSFEKLTNFTVQ